MNARHEIKLIYKEESHSFERSASYLFLFLFLYSLVIIQMGLVGVTLSNIINKSISAVAE